MENKNINLTELLLKAPLEIQDAVTSPEFGEKLEKIGEKHGLNINQLGVLADEIMAVLLQLKQAEDVTESLKKELGLDDEKLVFLVADLNDEIFLPLRDVMFKEEVQVPIAQESKPTPITPPEPTIEPPKQANPEGLKPFAEPKTIPQPIIEPVVTHLGEKLETPDEILKHIEELPELPKPNPEQVQTSTTPTPIIEPKPVENKAEKVPDQRKYTVDPYREPVE